MSKKSQSLKFRCQQPSADLLQGQRFRHIDRGAKILGVAHCDSVRCGSDHYVEHDKVVFSTALDDRLGVHVLLDLLPAVGIRCDVLLTDDEEIGRSTAAEFKTDRQYNWIFQFDRRGTDAVTYDFQAMDGPVKAHFELGQGSFSDICRLEHLNCGGVNVGCGYYAEHTMGSHCLPRETAAQIGRFRQFCAAFQDTHIPGTLRESWWDRDRVDTWGKKPYVGTWRSTSRWTEIDDCDDPWTTSSATVYDADTADHVYLLNLVKHYGYWSIAEAMDDLRVTDEVDLMCILEDSLCADRKDGAQHDYRY